VPRFTVIAPNSTSKWPVGTTQQIVWNCSSANEPLVNITYYIGSTEYVIAPAGQIDNDFPAGELRSINFDVPDNITADFRVKVRSSNINREDISHETGSAKIVGYFNISTPNGGGTQNFTVGGTVPITWERQGTVPYVHLYLLRYDLTNTSNYTSTAIALDLAQNLSLSYNTFNWTVNDTITPDFSCKILVSDRSSPFTTGGYDLSDDYFKIKGAFSVLTPAEGSRLNTGQPYNITFNTTGNITKVRIIAYSTDTNDSRRFNSTFNYTLDKPYNVTNSPPYNNTTGNGLSNYTWGVPDNATTFGMLRVMDWYDQDTTYAESGNFSIVGTFDITQPDGNESWIVGTNHSITWNKTGSSIAEQRLHSRPLTALTAHGSPLRKAGIIPMTA